jgi:Uri superfamily endonuclease
MTDIPTSAMGTYLLLARLSEPTRLTVGRLGAFCFQAGWYAYAGSALGPGGLRARLARHARTQKRIHWHIDYLLKAARLETSWQAVCPIRLECTWAATLSKLPSAQIAIQKFGASDCRCPGHLIYWPTRPNDPLVSQALQSHSPEQCSVQRNR